MVKPVLSDLANFSEWVDETTSDVDPIEFETRKTFLLRVGP
jgi:hypothetical protein